MKIEKENSNWAALTTPRYEAKNAPEIPPNAAPVPYARSLVRTMGIPAQAAADSSSRIAIHARPMRESRRLTFTTSASATSASANQYHGRRSSAPKRPINGSSMRSIGSDADRAGGERAAEELDLAAVGHDLADDLAEGERDDRDVVAAQPQRRHADQGAGDGRRRDGEREDEQEVDVDAGRAGHGVAGQDGDAAPVGPGVGPEARPEVGGRVRADREEGHVAEVEQAGEAHDDVEPERHHHVGGGQDHVVEDVDARAEEQRRDRGEREHGHHARERCAANAGHAGALCRSAARLTGQAPS